MPGQIPFLCLFRRHVFAVVHRHSDAETEEPPLMGALTMRGGGMLDNTVLPRSINIVSNCPGIVCMYCLLCSLLTVCVCIVCFVLC